MEREMCSHLEWQLNVDPSMLGDFQVLFVSNIWLVCMSLTITEARFRRIKNPSRQHPFSSRRVLLGQVALRELNQMDREMYSHLEWQLNVDPSTLRDFQVLLPSTLWLVCMSLTITYARFRRIKSSS